MAERFLRPLEMAHTTYTANDAIMHRTAIGHLETPDGPRISGHFRIHRGIAGSSGVISSAVDQVRWAAFHMGDGTAPSGERVMQAETLRSMQATQAEAGSMCDSFGFGWMLDDVQGHRVVKHGGSINGQLSSFEFVPDLGYGCTVLTNCDSGRDVRDTVARACLAHFAGLHRTTPAADPSLASTLPALTGHYKQRMVELDVDAKGDSLLVHDRQAAWIAALEPRASNPPPSRLQLFAPDRAVVVEGPHQGETAEWLRDDDGNVTFMRWDGRLSARTSG